MGTGTVVMHGSTPRALDSYTYSLLAILQEKRPSFAYSYIDGAHEWHHDGFAFLLVDKMVPVGGIVKFDDLPWTVDGSPSVNPRRHPEVLQRLTMQELEEKQVFEVFD